MDTKVTLAHNIDFSLITQTHKAVAVFDHNLCFIEGSTKWFKIHKLKEKKIIGKLIFDIFPKMTNSRKEKYKKCLQGEFYYNNQVQYTWDNGSQKWYKVGIRPWRNYEGEVSGVIMTTKDITQQKKKHRIAKRNKKLLEEVGQVSRIGGWDYDVAKKQLFWTSATKEIHGVDQSYTPNMETVIDFLKHEEDIKKTYRDIAEAIAHGRPYNVEVQIITAKGEERWINNNGKAEFKNGKCIRLYGTIHDINDRKNKEIKIAQSEERFRKTFDNATTGMLIVDPISYRFKQINQTACQIFGYSKEELLQLSFKDLCHNQTNDKSIDAIEQLSTGVLSSIKIEKTYQHKNGSSVIVELGASAIRDRYENIVNYICQIRDITEIKNKEKTIQDYITLAENQNERLLNFAHIVSHNLRSHSSNFSMLLDLFKVEQDMHQKQEILTLLNDASNQLVETIDNLNEVVAFNRAINKTKVHVPLRNFISKVINNVEILIQKNNVRIINDVPEALSILLVPAYMDSILKNLITNSIKYRSLERNPVIKFSATKTDDYIVLSVEDNGRGIDLKKHGHKLFGMYKTFHGNADAKGIGLFMTKNQVEVMNGKIEAMSTPRKGTTFKIYLNEKN